MGPSAHCNGEGTQLVFTNSQRKHKKVPKTNPRGSVIFLWEEARVPPLSFNGHFPQMQCLGRRLFPKKSLSNPKRLNCPQTILKGSNSLLITWARINKLSSWYSCVKCRQIAHLIARTADYENICQQNTRIQ